MKFIKERKKKSILTKQKNEAFDELFFRMIVEFECFCVE